MIPAGALFLLLAAPVRAQSESPVMGGVVRSNEWKIRRTPTKEEEFIGEVSYRGADTAVSADWALFRHAEKAWKLRGAVRSERRFANGDAVTAWGDEAAYDQGTGKGALWAKDRVRFERRPALGGEPDHGTAGRLSWTGKDKAKLTGGAHVWGPRLETWSDEAAYDRADGRLLLTGGRPVLRKLDGDWTGAVKADTISAWEDPRRVEADGKTRGWIEFPQKAAGAELAR